MDSGLSCPLMHQQVQWYLAEGLAAIRAQRQPDTTERRSSALTFFGAKLDALRYVEAISDEERADWHNRLLIALGIDPPPPAEPGTSRAIWTGPGSPPPPQRFDPPKFVRSWPGPDREFDFHNGRLRVISCELYDTMFTVRWRVAPEPDLAAVFPSEAAQLARDIEGVDEWAKKELQRKADRFLQSQRLFAFALHDDLGTEYRHRGRGSGGGPHGTRGEADFEPPPPPTATRLEFSWLDLTIDLPIA